MMFSVWVNLRRVWEEWRPSFYTTRPPERTMHLGPYTGGNHSLGRKTTIQNCGITERRRSTVVRLTLFGNTKCSRSAIVSLETNRLSCHNHKFSLSPEKDRHKVQTNSAQLNTKKRL